MGVCYNRLWKLLIDKGLKKISICKIIRNKCTDFGQAF